jgi:hypothetical protein
MRGDVGVTAPSLLPSQSTGTCAGPSSPGRPCGEHGAAACAHAKRRPRSAVDAGASHPRPTFDHPFAATPDSGATTKPLADHSDMSNLLRQPWPVPPHRRPKSSAVRTARLRTPDACLSGHPDHTGRVDTGPLDTGRPPERLDARPHGVRTSWTATTTATAGLAAQTSLGLQRPRCSAAHGVSAMTTHLPPRCLGSCAALLGMKPRLGALLSCVLDLDGTSGGQWDYGKVRCAGSGWCGSADGGAYEDGRGQMSR